LPEPHGGAMTSAPQKRGLYVAAQGQVGTKAGNFHEVMLF
jgi:hypothetical protein